MEQINKIKCTKSTAVGHGSTGDASYQINENYIHISEYENVIFKKIEDDPKEGEEDSNKGGKRRKSRRN